MQILWNKRDSAVISHLVRAMDIPWYKQIYVEHIAFKVLRATRDMSRMVPAHHIVSLSREAFNAASVCVDLTKSLSEERQKRFHKTLEDCLESEDFWRNVVAMTIEEYPEIQRGITL